MNTQTHPFAGTMMKGAVLGGSLGALGAWMALGSAGPGARKDVPDESDPLRSQAITLLHAYPHILTDSNMYVALQEPVPLFLQLDRESYP